MYFSIVKRTGTRFLQKSGLLVLLLFYSIFLNSWVLLYVHECSQLFQENVKIQIFVLTPAIGADSSSCTVNIKFLNRFLSKLFNYSMKLIVFWFSVQVAGGIPSREDDSERGHQNGEWTWFFLLALTLKKKHGIKCLILI